MQYLLDSLKFIKANFAAFYLYTLLFSLFGFVVDELLFYMFVDTKKTDLRILVALQFAAVFAVPFYQAAVAYVFNRAVEGNRPSLFEALAAGVVFWPSLFFANLIRVVVGIAILAPLLMLFRGQGEATSNFYIMLALIDLFIVMRIPFYDFKIVLENKSARSSLLESLQESRIVLPVLFATLLPVSIVTSILWYVIVISTPAGIMRSIVQFLLTTLLAVGYQAYLFRLYMEIKQVKKKINDLSPPNNNV